MHTTRTEGATFHHNSDMSGDVTIVTTKGSMDVPIESVCQFVAEALRANMIGEIAQRPWLDFLRRPA